MYELTMEKITIEKDFAIKDTYLQLVELIFSFARNKILFVR